MRYIDFQRHFRDFIVISLADIRLIEPDFDLRRLVEWQQKNYILQLKRGFYLFNKTTPHLTEEMLFYIANKLYHPSYVSLETALNYYNFIPETTFTITSVSTRKTQQISTQVGEFSYRSLKPELMFGYRLLPLNESSPDKKWPQQARLASPEKALLDFLYYQQNFKSQLDVSLSRFNREEMKQRVNLKQLRAEAAKFNSEQLKKRAALLVDWLNRA